MNVGSNMFAKMILPIFIGKAKNRQTQDVRVRMDKK